MNHDLYRAYQLALTSLAPSRQAWLATIRSILPWYEALPAPLQDAGAAMELLGSLQVSGERPPFALELPGVQEEVVCRLPFCTLLRFHENDGRSRPRVLLVAPLSGHYASRLRETIRTLLVDHEVLVTDWQNAREVPLAGGSFDLDDYVDYLLRFLRRLGPGVHLMAICQACPAALAATALLAEDKDDAAPLSLTLMCGPVDPHVNPTAIGSFAASTPLSWFERSMTAVVPPGFAGAGRWVAPGFLQLPSLSCADSASRLCSLLQACAGLGNWDRRQIEQARQTYRDELALLDLSAEFYLSTIERIFRQASLARGRMRWRGRPVRPAAIRDCALMTVEAGEDDVCGPGQTHVAHALCRALAPELRLHRTERRAGHVGLFTGPCWQESVFPALRTMIAQRERRLLAHAGLAREATAPRRHLSGLPVRPTGLQ